MKLDVDPANLRSSARSSAVGSPPRRRRKPLRARLRGEVGGTVVVDAGDQEAVVVDPVEELRERLVVGLLGAVVVEVVGLDVGDQRAVRRVDQEGAVALVGLRDEDPARAVVRVGAGLVELAADRERRVRGAVLQRDGEQRGGGGLAVRAGDRDDLAAAHHRLQRGGPRQQPQPQPLRLDHLGVVGPDGGGDHEGVDVADLVGRVADVAARPERTQRLEGAGLLGVAAADGHAARQHDPRDAGQPGTADAHEVHPAEPVGGQQLVGDGTLIADPFPLRAARCAPAARRRRAG